MALCCLYDFYSDSSAKVTTYLRTAYTHTSRKYLLLPYAFKIVWIKFQMPKS